MAFFKWFKKNKKEESVQQEDIQETIQDETTGEQGDNLTEETIKDKIEDIKEDAREIKEEVTEKIYNITEEIREKATEIKDKTKDKIEDIKEDSREIKEEVTEKIYNITEEIREKATEIKDKTKDKIENIKEESKEIKEEVTEKIDNITEEIREKATEIKEKAKDKIEDIKEESKEIKEEVAEKVEEITEEIKKKDDTLDTLEETKEEEAEEEPKKKVFFTKIKMGLSKTRDSILNGVEQVLSSFTKIDEELFEELEESLIMSDIGVETSIYIIGKVKEIVKSERIKEVAEVKNVIIRVISDILEEETDEFELKSPSVILVIGVNGVGKTTTIGKLASNYKKQGKKLILAAGDTFRAAAIDQLQVWGERSGIDVIKHQEGSDPAAVVFDAIQAGKARKADILICDTAGRLHNKKNLMEELKKIAKVVNRENPEAQIETLLVLDATTGQNALQQAKLFRKVANITGIVLTKLDGTAKGGVVIAIKNELKIPVRFIGVGEGIDDLRPFDAKEFSRALFE
ncbi:signal recognition particle-docking protein FtsY [[Clostridium] colinum]|uniref:signal recognition particle-docking protein FtsY n=1 Tax=[Clostridium] colinum TaxID=36835 RepID=UPI0020253E07|nr:signal recognition particle-docking protein FtsY [[Clostridium] colinum]